jgi:hypothetical protein
VNPSQTPASKKKQLCRKSDAALSALSATTGTSTQRAEKALIASPELWQVNSNKIAAYRQKVQQINSTQINSLFKEQQCKNVIHCS